MLAPNSIELYYTAAQNKFSQVVSPFVKFGKIWENLHLGKITRYTVCLIATGEVFPLLS